MKKQDTGTCCECPCTPCGDAPQPNSSLKNTLIVASAILLGSIIVSGSIFALSQTIQLPKEEASRPVVTPATPEKPTGSKPTLAATTNAGPDIATIGVPLSIDETYQKTGDMPPVEGLPFLGSADAKVTVVEFSDFECPYCHGYYQNVFLQLKKDYIDTGKVKFVYKDFPLFSIHPKAATVANAAHCAEKVVPGSYYPFHDMVFDNFDTWRSASNLKEALIAMAGNLKISRDSFESCLEGYEFKELIEENMTHGYAWGVRGTPTTFINSQEIKGMASYATIKAMIEAELAK